MLVRRSLLMPYPAESMFDLIEQAEYYPQFIPWCTEAVILEVCRQVGFRTITFVIVNQSF